MARYINGRWEDDRGQPVQAQPFDGRTAYAPGLAIPAPGGGIRPGSAVIPEYDPKGESLAAEAKMRAVRDATAAAAAAASEADAKKKEEGPPGLSEEAKAYLKQYSEEAFSAPGTSPWEKLMEQQIASTTQKRSDDLVAQQASSQAQARSMSAMRGGASPWLSPALARGAMRQGIQEQQGISAGAQDARLQAASSAEQQKDAAKRFVVNAQRSYWDPSFQVWQEQMKLKGSQAIADAMRNGGGDGGGPLSGIPQGAKEGIKFGINPGGYAMDKAGLPDWMKWGVDPVRSTFSSIGSWMGL